MKKALIAAGVFIIDAMTVIGFYIAFNNLKKAILWSIPIFIGCLIMIIISLLLQMKDLKDEMKKKEHSLEIAEEKINSLSNQKSANEKQIDALIMQNKNQRKKVQRIYEQWNGLNIVFTNAIQNSKKERFEEAYKLYLLQTAYLFNDNKEDL